MLLPLRVRLVLTWLLISQAMWARSRRGRRSAGGRRVDVDGDGDGPADVGASARDDRGIVGCHADVQGHDDILSAAGGAAVVDRMLPVAFLMSFVGFFYAFMGYIIYRREE